MVRRVATQVHKQAARLIESRYIREEPAWYQAVLDHPPLPLPPRAPPARPHGDTPQALPTGPKHTRPRTPRTPPIYYIEDDVRRQFFRDHPFEAYRPRSIVESGAVEEENPISGPAWTRLRQRGRTPCSETYVPDLSQSFFEFSS
jgi:small subunit ribosomal protein S23